MELKNMLGVLLTIMIAIIMIGSLLAPTITNYQEPERSVTNTGSYFALVDDEGTAHEIIISAGSDGFAITTDGAADVVPNMATYNPGGVETAEYLALGVYEAYNLDGVLVSQAGRTPTASQNIDVFRTQALAGNTDNANGTYQLWNWYQYTLYKEMASAIMGNTDSQYMMGPGKSAGSGPNTTGLTDAAYAKSADSSASVSLLLENAWGSVWEFVGDTTFADYVMSAGNALGGNSVVRNQVENKLTGTVTIPSGASKSWIESIYATSEAWGAPLTITTTTPTAGQGINDSMWSNTDNRLLDVGGNWNVGSSGGLSAFRANHALGDSYAIIGARLAYLTDAGAASASAVGGARDFGYIITYDATAGTISDVQALIDGSLTSVMPTGTALNDYWTFGTDGVGPFGAYYAAINLASGSNDDDAVQARLSTDKGAVAYILDPANLKQTLAGNTFDPTLYNVMLMIPTVYSYSDASAGKLYLGSAADTFDGVTMSAYGHTYTVDPDVITGNPVTTSSASLAVGENAILRLYSTGDLRIITTTGTVNLGQVSAENPVTVTVTGDVLGYTDSASQAGTVSGIKAYIASDGEMTMTLKPYVLESSEVIIGGYAHNLNSTDGDVVSIGYCASGAIADISAPTAVLAPVSKDGNTVSSTAVDVNLDKVRSDLYKVDKLLFESTWSDGETTTATYTYFLAPGEIRYDNPEYVGDDYSAIFGAIIVIAIAALLMIGVGMVTRRD